MAKYKYKTVPFSGNTQEKDKTKGTTLAFQLDDLINKFADAGWEFDIVDSLTISISNGCLASFSGNPFSLQTYNVVIFRVEV